eukprot:Opistho-2@33662
MAFRQPQGMTILRDENANVANVGDAMAGKGGQQRAAFGPRKALGDVSNRTHSGQPPTGPVKGNASQPQQPIKPLQQQNKPKGLSVRPDAPADGKGAKKEASTKRAIAMEIHSEMGFAMPTVSAAAFDDIEYMPPTPMDREYSDILGSYSHLRGSMMPAPSLLGAPYSVSSILDEPLVDPMPYDSMANERLVTCVDLPSLSLDIPIGQPFELDY